MNPRNASVEDIFNRYPVKLLGCLKEGRYVDAGNDVVSTAGVFGVKAGHSTMET